MLSSPALVAGLCCACAAFAGCAFQTDGLIAPSGSSGTSVTSSTTGGSSMSLGTGGIGASSSTSTGTGALSQEDAGSEDASTDAAPVDAGPTAYASCLAWLTARPGAASGVYDLLDDSQNVYAAYCEMEGDAGAGGGWTLALKIDGTKTTFPYDDALWSNSTAYEPAMPDLDMNEAKLASFWSVPFTELRVGMIDAGVTRWLIVPIGGTSLLDLLNNHGSPTTTLGRGAWEGLLATGSLQTPCNWEGINADGHVRIGIVGDESFPLCNSPDSFIGFGADTSFQAPSFDCGNIAHYTPDHGDQTTRTFGYVMVR
jgi:hypothetical protein